jgi:hypothetical protein
MVVKLTAREKAVENELKLRVRVAGGVCEKVRALGTRGFFDRLVVLPAPPAGGYEIMARPRILFVELKRPKGGRLSAHQIQLHTRYQALGAAVYIVKDSADIDRLMTCR